MRRAALALAVLALGACASPRTVAPPPPPPQQQPVVPPPTVVAPPPAAQRVEDGRIRVALLVPLTGRGSEVGQAMLDAAQMAVTDVADDRFLLLPRDTAGTPEGAASAARDALTEGARLILGPLFGVDATAIRPAATGAGVPVLSFSNDAGVAGDGLWVLGFQPQDQINRVVSFAIARGLDRFGLLAPVGPYGDAVQDAMSQAVLRSGGQLVRADRFRPGSPDLTQTVRAFAEFDRRRQPPAREGGPQTSAEAPYRAVLIAEGGQNLKEVASLLPFFDVDPGPVRFLGTGQWDEPGLGREPALVGGWFAAPAPEGRQGFEARFQSLFGRRPPRLASLAYDGTALAAALARSGGPAPFTPSALMDPNGFAGVDGIFRLLPAGRTERGLAILEVTRSGAILVDPAPQTFQVPAS